MKPEIQDIINTWKELAEKINKYPPKNIMLSPNYNPFRILWDSGSKTYILCVDLNVFDDNE